MLRRRIFTETRGPFERFLRVMALMAVVAVSIMLYQRHFENALDRIQSKTAIWDQAGVLDDESRQYIRSVSKDLENNLGIELRVWVRTEPFEPPELAPKILFLGVCLPLKTAVVVFPPLAAKALGPDIGRFLEEEHFRDYFKQGDPATGVVAAVGLIYQALSDELSGGAPGEKGDDAN